MNFHIIKLNKNTLLWDDCKNYPKEVLFMYSFSH